MANTVGESSLCFTTLTGSGIEGKFHVTGFELFGAANTSVTVVDRTGSPIFRDALAATRSTFSGTIDMPVSKLSISVFTTGDTSKRLIVYLKGGYR